MDAALSDAARQLKATYQVLDVSSFDDLEPLLRRLVREGVDAIVMGPHPIFRPHLRQIADLLIHLRLPSVGMVTEGFLLSFQYDELRLARKSAGYVVAVLSGVRPADLPVEQASVFVLSVNLKTAAAMGLKLPQTLLARADNLVR